jgi:hypothetical protein
VLIVTKSNPGGDFVTFYGLAPAARPAPFPAPFTEAARPPRKRRTGRDSHDPDGKTLSHMRRPSRQRPRNYRPGIRAPAFEPSDAALIPTGDPARRRKPDQEVAGPTYAACEGLTLSNAVPVEPLAKPAIAMLS